MGRLWLWEMGESLPHYKTTIKFEMVSITISYFSFTKSALLDSLRVPLSFEKIYCSECKGSSPILGVWPFGTSFFCAGILVAYGDVIGKHVNDLLLGNVCFPRTSISVTVSSLNSLKSVKFLYWCSFFLTDTLLLSAIYANYLNDFRSCPLFKRSRNRSRENWSRIALWFMEFDFSETNSVLSHM